MVHRRKPYYTEGAAWLAGEPAAADTYDLQADTYDLEYEGYTRDLAFWHQAAGEAGSPVLEIGCGTGRIALPLAEAGFEVTGVDHSPRMLAVAQAKPTERMTAAGGSVTWICADAQALPLPDAAFALTMVPFGVFNYMVGLREQMAAAAEVSRVTRMGGRAIIDVAHFPLGTPIMSGNRPLMVESVSAQPQGQLVRYGQSRLTPGWNTSDYVELVEILDSVGAVKRRAYEPRWHLFTLL